MLAKRALSIGAIGAALALSSGCKDDHGSAAKRAPATPPPTTEAPPAKPSPPSPPPSPLPTLPADPGVHEGTHRWSARFGDLGTDAGRSIATDANGNVAVTGYFAEHVEFAPGHTATAAALDAYVAYFSAQGELSWVKTFGGDHEDTGNAIAFDPEGNVVVAGNFSRSMQLGATPVASLGSDDAFVLKLSPTGEVLWVRRFGDIKSDGANGVATDAHGNVYVTGSFSGLVTFGTTQLSSAGGEDVFVLALTAAGELMWVEQFGGRYTDYGQRIAVDPQGSVVVLAEFTGTVAFGAAELESLGNRDLAVLKLSSRGEVTWAERFGSPFNELGLGLAVDPAGNIIIAGSFDNQISFGAMKLVSKGESDAFVTKLNPAGKPQWARSFGSRREDIAHGAATDAFGNVVVTGWFWEAIDFGGGLRASEGNKDVFLLKLSPDGNHRWSRRFGGKDHDQGRAVAVGPSAEVVATGIFRFVIELGGKPLESKRAASDRAPRPDVFVARFAP